MIDEPDTATITGERLELQLDPFRFTPAGYALVTSIAAIMVTVLAGFIIRALENAETVYQLAERV